MHSHFKSVGFQPCPYLGLKICSCSKASMNNTPSWDTQPSFRWIHLDFTWQTPFLFMSGLMQGRYNSATVSRLPTRMPVEMQDESFWRDVLIPTWRSFDVINPREIMTGTKVNNKITVDLHATYRSAIVTCTTIKVLTSSKKCTGRLRL